MSTQAQSRENAPVFHTIKIFKSSKIDGKTKNISINIDSTGNVEYNKQKQHSKMDMPLLKAGIHKFVEYEKLQLLPADNDPPKMMPKIIEGEQYVYFQLAFYDSSEKNLYNKTRYEWWKIYSVSVNEMDFYKFLDEENLKIIKNLLK